LEVSESIILEGELEAVFAYVAEFANAERWDPGVRSSEKLTAGPLSVGDRYRVAALLGGIPTPMDYEVIALNPPLSVTLRGKTAQCTTHDRIEFSAVEGGTRVHWHLRLEFSGASAAIARLVRPLVRRFLDRLAHTALDGLERTWNREHGARGPQGAVSTASSIITANR